MRFDATPPTPRPPAQRMAAQVGTMRAARSSLLARVTMRHYAEHPDFKFYSDEEGGTLWKLQRHNIVNAILKFDPELARFEAMRRRTHLMNLFDMSADAAGNRKRG